jgi:hypothetical protein
MQKWVTALPLEDSKFAADKPSQLLSPEMPAGRQSLETEGPEQNYTTLSTSSIATSTNHVVQISDKVRIQRYEQKSKEICQKLRASLPPYDQLKSALELNGSWWNHFHRKTHPFAKAKEYLVGYAAHLYTSNDPIDLGILVIAFARSTSQDHQLYSLVEQLVISDQAYNYSIHGLECLLLLAKVYTDIGQPRRSWCLTRSGLNRAQLMVNTILEDYLKLLIDLKQGFISTIPARSEMYHCLALSIPHGSLRKSSFRTSLRCQ